MIMPEKRKSNAFLIFAAIHYLLILARRMIASQGNFPANNYADRANRS
jgi:hypothetical protein